MVEVRVEERIVAFVDVLGFRERVLEKEASGDDPWFESTHASLERSIGAASRLRLSDAEELIRQEESLLAPHSASPRVEITAVTDCFVLSAPVAEGGAERAVADRATALALCMLEQEPSLFSRGGIARGRGIHAGNAVISAGQIRAYELETHSAVFPRIVLADEVAEELKSQYCGPLSDLTIRRDFDGCWYLDLFATLAGREMPREIFEGIRSAIARELRESKRHAHLAKWRWCAVKFNEHCGDEKIGLDPLSY